MQTCLVARLRIGMNGTLLANEENGGKIILWIRLVLEWWGLWLGSRWCMRWNGIIGDLVYGMVCEIGLWCLCVDFSIGWQYDLEFLAQFEVGELWGMFNKSFMWCLKFWLEVLDRKLSGSMLEVKMVKVWLIWDDTKGVLNSRASRGRLRVWTTHIWCMNHVGIGFESIWFQV